MYSSDLLRTAVSAFTAAALTLAGTTSAVASSPSQPRARSASMVTAPGSFTGYGFDACSAPSQQTMDAWRTASPYAAVGIYIGGSNRLCDQPELDATWVRTQASRGWHLLPVHVGPQASCAGYADVMSPDRAVAEQQGRAEARAAVAAARALAIGKASTLYYDVEDFDVADSTCRQAVLAFVSGWTKQLHSLGYESGVYSNVAAAIHALDNADNLSPGSYVMPDDIWFAWANGRADTRIDDKWVRPTSWRNHQRIHQYALDTTRSYGGVDLVIDVNWVDVGRGSVKSTGKPLCRGVEVDRKRYPRLRRGARGSAVKSVQCLLRRHHHGRLRISGLYDDQTARAVRSAQRRVGLKASDRVDRATWVALLSRGSRPLLKVGSTGEAVRRVQRALTAALGQAGGVNGVMTKRTSRAVATYQRRQGLTATGNVDREVWDLLRAGG